MLTDSLVLKDIVSLLEKMIVLIKKSEDSNDIPSPWSDVFEMLNQNSNL